MVLLVQHGRETKNMCSSTNHGAGNSMVIRSQKAMDSSTMLVGEFMLALYQISRIEEETKWRM